MRIVFINLHNNGKMVKVLEKYLFKISVSKKHRYLLDYLLENNIPVCNYISKNTGYSVELLNKICLPFYPLRLVEAKIILKMDGIDTRKIKTLYRTSDIQSDDIVILYCLKDEWIDMDKVNAFKVVSLLHASCTSNMAELIRKANIQCFYNEADLRKMCTLFQRHYEDLRQPIIVIPFVFEERFQKKKVFRERLNKAIAIGTIAYRTDKEFMDEYGGGCYQPLRKMLRDQAAEMPDYYDCVIDDYGENEIEKVVEDKDSLPMKLYKKIWNKKHIGQQKRYFSFDMVEKLNQYKMCIVGEEIIGVPGIGFVEAMACGCAYIGCTKYDYKSYGMEENIHYIGYDGSLEDLKRKIDFYQQHETELEQIANNGNEFCRKNFNRNAVSKKLLEGLRSAKKNAEK